MAWVRLLVEAGGEGGWGVIGRDGFYIYIYVCMYIYSGRWLEVIETPRRSFIHDCAQRSSVFGSVESGQHDKHMCSSVWHMPGIVS